MTKGFFEYAQNLGSDTLMILLAQLGYAPSGETHAQLVQKVITYTPKPQGMGIPLGIQIHDEDYQKLFDAYLRIGHHFETCFNWNHFPAIVLSKSDDISSL
jgi:hypothetical protein